MKNCFVRFYENLHVLYDNRYIRVSLFNFTDGGECALVAFKKAGPKTALDVLEHFGVEE